MSENRENRRVTNSLNNSNNNSNTSNNDGPALSREEIAYMRLVCAGPDRLSWAAEKALRGLAEQLGVRP